MPSSTSKASSQSHVAPTPTINKNIVMVQGVAVPNVVKTGSYAENVSNNGGIVEFIDQYRAQNN